MSAPDILLEAADQLELEATWHAEWRQVGDAMSDRLEAVTAELAWMAGEPERPGLWQLYAQNALDVADRWDAANGWVRIRVDDPTLAWSTWRCTTDGVTWPGCGRCGGCRESMPALHEWARAALAALSSSGGARDE